MMSLMLGPEHAQACVPVKESGGYWLVHLLIFLRSHKSDLGAGKSGRKDGEGFEKEDAVSDGDCCGAVR
ncbi:hypothetical protein Tb927.7.7350 [Trypanosoma brucei brucei TREU927]|uniref:Uncharacterized protein n=2 Tax=Trypanosoma brucei TaxID=5691 RepID=Q57TX2_TRYB2|nr:hypothetical protein Tb927.7.7350 [Trypanosoma brucei brucei TREU927]AAX79983.1 hypothetical protein Tb927.7.7350 [Trypanosoma brucei]AAZ12796.1 hypothetical protein Tb927.7.7350 [Trypanosoma brucei brucei TREU927]RHW71656.1 hypothetical protein DPX39_070082300 [Trypanosoma brucei equiperdum]